MNSIFSRVFQRQTLLFQCQRVKQINNATCIFSISAKNYQREPTKMTSLDLKKKALFDFTGPMSAVSTPFDTKGNLNVSQITKYAQYLTRIGVKGVYIIGTTGEGYSLTLDEKLSLVEAWRAALDQLPTDQQLTAVVNVSSTVVSDVVRLAAKVEQLGFDGVALLPPIYYSVSSSDQLVAYVKSILDQAAPNTPFLYYHIPSFTGEFKFELEHFLESALEQIPQLVALKFTDNNLVRFGSIQNKLGHRINLFAGFDETLLATRSLGGKAAICATFGFAQYVSHYHSMVEAVDRGDLAAARQHQRAIAAKCAELRDSGNFFAALKQALNKEVEKEGLAFGAPRAPMFIE